MQAYSTTNDAYDTDTSLSARKKDSDIDNSKYRDFVIRVLKACHWLDSADSSASNLQINILARSHVVAKVISSSGDTVFIKFPTQHSLETQRDLRNELFVYRLTQWNTFFRELLPKVIFLDERKQVLVLESLTSKDESSWQDSLVSHSILDPFVLNNLGETMAMWHAETAKMTLLPSVATGILRLKADYDEIIMGRSPYGKKLFKLLIDDDALSYHLKKCRNMYEYDCLIHGDIRTDNMMIKPSEGSLILKIIDWEISGKGDHYWDISSVFAEILINDINTNHSDDLNTRFWPDTISVSGKIFLEAYKKSGGDLNNIDKIPAFTIARLLHIATEWAEQEENWNYGLVDKVLEQTRRLIANEKSAVNEITSWL